MAQKEVILRQRNTSKFVSRNVFAQPNITLVFKQTNFNSRVQYLQNYITVSLNLNLS